MGRPRKKILSLSKKRESLIGKPQTDIVNWFEKQDDPGSSTDGSSDDSSSDSSGDDADDKGIEKKNADDKGTKKKKKIIRSRTHGWFCIVEAGGTFKGGNDGGAVEGLITVIEPMRNAEDNAIVRRCFKKAAEKNSRASVAVYDRACKFKKPLHLVHPRLKDSSCDKFHGRKHQSSCKRNPWVHDRLWEQLKGAKTSIAESVYGWMRGFARICNTMGEERHQLFMVTQADRHNTRLSRGDRTHLCVWKKEEHTSPSPDAKKIIPYACTKKKAPMKVATRMKALKKMKVKKTPTKVATRKKGRAKAKKGK